jgi:hypothetical protein
VYVFFQDSVSEGEGTKGINTEDLKEHSAAQPQPQTIKKKPRMDTNGHESIRPIRVHSRFLFDRLWLRLCCAVIFCECFLWR